ncbi:MAG TPA: hypothetical protein DD727_09390 [Clostridiales bacterium]|nr:hypothetical protein [Clostridiales bacterium]
MSKTIAAVFSQREDAEKASLALKEEGFELRHLSIVAKQPEKPAAEQKDREDDEDDEGDEGEPIRDNISDGIVTGGILGGLAGLLIGAGSLAIPGLGIIAAAGPVAGLLSGVVTGGVVGGLVDLGIPEDSSKKYEKEIREGRILMSLSTSYEKVEEAVKIIKENGAIKVDVY